MKSYHEHERDVHALIEAIQNSQGTVALGQNPEKSNVTRTKVHKEGSTLLPVSQFNQVIKIDEEKKLLLVEPRVTMEQMVRETLKFGLIPKMVPEFRGITVGGAVVGAGIESSAFKEGLFHDICPWFEMVTGDGRHLRCSPNSHEDLYHAVAGSYGALGFLTLIAVELMPAKPYLHLHYRRAHSVKDLKEVIEAFDGDFIEALATGHNQFTIISGRLTNRLPKHAGLPLFSMKNSWSPWFYQHAYRVQPPYDEMMPLEEYLFRYDRGAFWMGQYLQKPSMMAAYLFQKSAHLEPGKTTMPNPLFRLLCGWAMGSQRLYRQLHKMPRKVLRNLFLIQDSGIPWTHLEEALDWCSEHLQIYPLWLCPCRTASQPQLFSPHSIEGEWIMNVGTYGVGGVEKTKSLEQKVAELGGKKALYSHNYYSPTAFWQIYDRTAYEQLRKKYGAEGRIRGIEERVLTED